MHSPPTQGAKRDGHIPRSVVRPCPCRGHPGFLNRTCKAGEPPNFPVCRCGAGTSAISSCHLLVTALRRSRTAALGQPEHHPWDTDLPREPLGAKRCRRGGKRNGPCFEVCGGESILLWQRAEGQAGFKRCSKPDDLLEAYFFPGEILNLP